MFSDLQWFNLSAVMYKCTPGGSQDMVTSLLDVVTVATEQICDHPAVKAETFSQGGNTAFNLVSHLNIL